MARTKQVEKRKREEETAGNVTKKPKKSKTSAKAPDAPPPSISLAEKKDKREKKDKKSKKVEESGENPAAEGELIEEEKPRKSKDKNIEADLITDMKTSENFISVNDDAPMPDASEVAGSTGSKKDKKQSGKAEKKSKKEKKSKPSKDVGAASPSREDTVTAVDEQNGVIENASVELNGTKSEPKTEKKKKEKKTSKKGKKNKKGMDSTSGGTSAEELPEGDVPTEKANDEESTEKKDTDEGAEDVATDPERNKGRFIVFVGMNEFLQHYAIVPTDLTR